MRANQEQWVTPKQLEKQAQSMKRSIGAISYIVGACALLLALVDVFMAGTSSSHFRISLLALGIGMLLNGYSNRVRSGQSAAGCAPKPTNRDLP